MTSFARAERLALADTLLAAGPDAPTLCDGWATRDLAAHLVLRERRPDAAAGILITAVQRHTKQVQDRLAAGDYAALVGKVRRPALWVRPAFADEAVNITEFLVHHEDVRRAAPGWTPRALDAAYEQALAGRLKQSARLSTRRFPAAITVEPQHGTPFTVGKGGDELHVHGKPSELLLFFTGRQAAADVTVTGPDALADRLKGARLGL
ncbi:TIGR03085 family metal-binding protein [Dactylosporangium sp. NBC_01737]|uniref:TIGR03085 family metal-binding protein n=1 Tax=Dactylosporangium sp. NBC_01737 TaxID=2975959 RepID=UPI002E0EAEB8|nr:TIGR03085 family metal-binding protein [Dactylosporangium sp. NBC_01737]